MTYKLNRYEESLIRNKDLPEEWREQSSLDELAHFLQSNWEQRSVFFDDGVIINKQQFIRFEGHKNIRTNNYVGTIVFKGKQLNIFPKIFRLSQEDHDTECLDLHHLMKNLVQWLQYCNRFDYPFINISSRLEKTEDLREFFITLYLHYIRYALERGLYYRYENVKEDLSTIKGKIDFKDYINQKIPHGLSNKFKCDHSEFKLDNNVNQVIKYTCMGIINDTKSPQNYKIIQQILFRLNDVSDVKCIPSDCDGIHLSKMHSIYSVLISMSKIFLLNQSSGYEIDNHKSFCFLFPTELLFEGFIGGFISEALLNEAKVKLQASDQTLIDNVQYAGQDLGRAFTMRHDILVEHKTYGIFLLDTKYKQMPRFKDSLDVKSIITRNVYQGDLYQIVEYAAHRNLSKAYLLYPMYRFEEEEPNNVILERISQSGIKIDIHIVRLPFIFEDDIKLTKQYLSNSLNRIFTWKYLKVNLIA